MTLAQARPTGLLWRVGRYPDPWAWVPHEFAGDQRWDSADGTFRTVYAAESPFACYVELLAPFRPDPAVVDEMSRIAVDAESAVMHATLPAGRVPRGWTDSRRLSSAHVAGVYCDVTQAATVADLRPGFLPLALALGLPDFDAAALKLARPRALTQEVAATLYNREAGQEELFAGVRFASRHGDDLWLWAIFERPGDEPFSRLVSYESQAEIARHDPDLLAAFGLHGLEWADH